MKTIIIISIIFFIIISFNLFLYLLGKKIKKLEVNIIDLLKRRNNQTVTIYGVTKNILVRHNEIFDNFLKLKRQDFGEDSYETNLKNKMTLYEKIHYEINFIIKVCEKHKEITSDPKYIYIKESILNKSFEVGEKIDLYKEISKKYNFLCRLSYITIIGFFLN